MSAIEIHAHLLGLQAERALAWIEGLAGLRTAETPAGQR